MIIIFFHCIFSKLTHICLYFMIHYMLIIFLLIIFDYLHYNYNHKHIIVLKKSFKSINITFSFQQPLLAHIYLPLVFPPLLPLANLLPFSFLHCPPSTQLPHFPYFLYNFVVFLLTPIMIISYYLIVNFLMINF